MKLSQSIALTLLAILAGSPPAPCQTPNDRGLESPPSVHVDLGDRGMVVSDSAPASRIGCDILRRGGTAVDAAVATAMALAVSWPDAGNIGGGGFMMIRPADGTEPVCVDYRETAPRTMQAGSFTRNDTTYSHKAVGIPGTVRGLAAAHQRFGRLPWRDLVLPAASLASDGVPVDQPLADSLNSVLSEPRVIQEPRFAELRRVYGRNDGRPWQPGDRLRLPDLAKTLELIAHRGPDAFYDGPVAEAIVAEMNRGDGAISLDDLRTYQAKIRPVIRGDYRGFTILGAPPPSSGGICVVESLNILENFDLASRDRYDPVTIHLIAEAMRRAFADRANYLGDPDFVEIPNRLTDKGYAKSLASSIDPNQATRSASIGPEITVASESPDTTHFSIVDRNGMAVSNTYTLEATWGSRIVVRDAGFVLNNEMGDFNWFPGETNEQGRIGTPPNTVAGGKRMLSSQSPVIVERDGQLVLVTGSPGGRTIINTVLCILINWIDFGHSPAEAVASMRMHHQWFPDRIELEKIDQAPHAGVVAALSNLGHVTRGRSAQGSAHTIAVDLGSKQLIGISDFRRAGRPASLRSRSIARWDFAEPSGRSIDQTSTAGESHLGWSTPIAGALTDGRDHLRIHSSATDAPRSTFIPLPKSTGNNARSTRWEAEIKIDSASFQGEEPNEEVVFAISGGAETNPWLAKMTIGRRGNDAICLWGQSPDEEIEPFELSRSNTLDRPVVLRMMVDTARQAIEIASRSSSQESFTTHGRLEFNAKSSPDRFQLELVHDLAGDQEFVNIDRIELLESLLTETVGRE